MLNFKTRVLTAGTARAKTVLLQEPLSFWGGYDPQTGKIVDKHHPQEGVCVKDAIMIVPQSRGSAGTPAGVAESVRQGTGPAGVILQQPDVNIAVGMLVAARLYQAEIPVVVADTPDYDRLTNNVLLEIQRDGSVCVIDEDP